MSHPEDAAPDRRRRLSITKLQRRSVPGAELIALCQSITEDGTLSDFEILALEGWLVDSEAIELSARDHLFALVRQFADDGVISAQERSELYKAIELVLPPDIRSVVRRTRRAGERATKAKEAQSRAAVREAAIATARAERRAAREAQLRARPLEIVDFMVAGVTYEDRASIVDQFCDEDDVVYLARDRHNAFSKNAVEVRLNNGLHIGYVPETMARDVAQLLDSGCPHSARIKKILAGSRAPIPVVLAAIYRQDCGRTDVVSEDRVPAKVTPK